MQVKEPTCNCSRPGGAHDEKCDVIRWMRSSEYDPEDLTPPAHLRRDIRQSVSGETIRESVFD